MLLSFHVYSRFSSVVHVTVPFIIILGRSTDKGVADKGYGFYLAPQNILQEQLELQLSSGGFKVCSSDAFAQQCYDVAEWLQWKLQHGLSRNFISRKCFNILVNPVSEYVNNFSDTHYLAQHFAGKVRFMAKLHKSPIGFCRMENDSCNILSEVARWVAQHLELVVKHICHTCILASKVVVAELSNCSFSVPNDQHCFLVGSDIVDFYPSIDLADAKVSVQQFVVSFFGHALGNFCLDSLMSFLATSSSLLVRTIR